MGRRLNKPLITTEEMEVAIGLLSLVGFETLSDRALKDHPGWVKRQDGALLHSNPQIMWQGRWRYTVKRDPPMPQDIPRPQKVERTVLIDFWDHGDPIAGYSGKSGLWFRIRSNYPSHNSEVRVLSKMHNHLTYTVMAREKEEVI